MSAQTQPSLPHFKSPRPPSSPNDGPSPCGAGSVLTVLVLVGRGLGRQRGPGDGTRSALLRADTSGERDAASSSETKSKRRQENPQRLSFFYFSEC